MTPSSTHLVLLPSYNTGARLLAVAREAVQAWQPVLVVIDGSSDDSAAGVLALARSEPSLHVLVQPRNGGKGSAVLTGARWAAARGYTHVLTMDADGQHLAAQIEPMMRLSHRRPDALILGEPLFPPNVPKERLYFRRISTLLVAIAILSFGIADPLFGFRVYPIGPLRRVLEQRRGGRRYDFDAEAAVRLVWSGVPPINTPQPVRYFSAAEGGVSHFHYVRDNLTLARMHLRLIGELLLWRWPAVLRLRRLAPAPAHALAAEAPVDSLRR